MSTNRKIALVVNQIHRDDEDKLDVLYWMSRPASERLQEVVRLRENYFTWLHGSFPKKIQKIVERRKL